MVGIVAWVCIEKWARLAKEEVRKPGDGSDLKAKPESFQRKNI